MATNQAVLDAITALNPTIYWVMDESSGNPVQQGSSTAGSLALSGSFTRANAELIPGDSTKFLSLTGGKGTASIGNITVPFGTCSFTFIVHVPSAPASSNSTFFSVGATGETTATNFQFLCRYLTYPNLEFFWEYSSTGTNVEVDSGARIDSGIYNNTVFQPTHVTIVKNSTDKTITTYINGFRRETISYVTEPTGGTSTSFFIGGAAVAVPSETLTMNIGHFAMFQRLLSQQEVVDLAKASGFMPVDYDLGQAQFEISTENAENYATLESIKALDFSASKLLSITLDPLIDPSLLAGAEAYSTTE